MYYKLLIYKELSPRQYIISDCTAFAITSDYIRFENSHVISRLYQRRELRI